MLLKESLDEGVVCNTGGRADTRARPTRGRGAEKNHPVESLDEGVVYNKGRRADTGPAFVFAVASL